MSALPRAAARALSDVLICKIKIIKIIKILKIIQISNTDQIITNNRFQIIENYYARVGRAASARAQWTVTRDGPGGAGSPGRT